MSRMVGRGAGRACRADAGRAAAGRHLDRRARPPGGARSCAAPFTARGRIRTTPSLVLRATVRRCAHPAARRRRGRGAAGDARAPASTCGADVLKVPHHGSAYFDPAFLAAVHARVGGDQRRGAQRLRPSVARRCWPSWRGSAVPGPRTDIDGDVAVVGAARGALHVVVRDATASRRTWRAAAAAGDRAAGPSRRSGRAARMACRGSPCRRASTTCPSRSPPARPAGRRRGVAGRAGHQRGRRRGPPARLRP